MIHYVAEFALLTVPALVRPFSVTRFAGKFALSIFSVFSAR